MTESHESDRLAQNAERSTSAPPLGELTELETTTRELGKASPQASPARMASGVVARTDDSRERAVAHADDSRERAVAHVDESRERAVAHVDESRERAVAHTDESRERAQFEAQRLTEIRHMLRAGNGIGALQALAELDRQASVQLLVQEREALRIDAYLLLGQEGEVRRLVQRFRQRYPNSPLATRWAKW